MSRVLVTGGCGFIGSAMVKLLLKKGFDVRVFDISFQIEDNPPPKEAEIYKGSILDVNDLMNAMKDCDYVIHLAAALGVKRTESERLSTLTINIQGTVNVLEACVRDDIKKIVFSSSSEVYGEQPSNKPISEENPLNPKSIYAVTKIACEEYLKAYHQRYNLNYSIVRFFNVYGPNQVAEFVIPRFINAVMNNTPPQIYGDGNQCRSFCYVDDAVNGAYLALINDKADRDVFNIGNDLEPITIRDLAYKIIDIAGKNIEPVFIPLNDSDRTIKREIFFRIPDISKARRILRYEPKVPLREGILKIIEHGKINQTWAKPTTR